MGRGPKRFTYTYGDLSRLTRRAIGTLRNDVAAKVFDPGDLESVLRYVLRYRPDLSRAC